jgi:hypothetical protein
MGFLVGLWTVTVPELPVAEDVITADVNIDPGYLYRISGSDDPITLTLLPFTVADIAGLRLAIKVYAAAPTPPGGALAIVMPGGQLIEGDDGALAATFELADQTVGTFREWLADNAGNWLLIGALP